MNFQSTADESKIISINTSSQKKLSRKRRKKSARKNLQLKKKHFECTMSAWAENFTIAATWQIKHQLAYWKARAKSLEYENRVLHDIIRKKHYVGSNSETSTQIESTSTTQMDTEFESDDNDYNGTESDNFVVSEEFIKFLKENAKFKEDARCEREKLKAEALAEEQSEMKLMEAGPPEHKENQEEYLRELYGDHWQRIAALEMSLDTNFIHETDKDKPVYWPNTPLVL